MNFIQCPPVHYPNSHDSTLEVFRTRNFSLNEPPAYGAERAPPKYQEATDAELGEQDDPEEASRARRTRIIRIMTSILVVTIVALIVAGVVSKMSSVQNESSDLGDSSRKYPSPTSQEASAEADVSTTQISDHDSSSTTTEEPSKGDPQPRDTLLDALINIRPSKQLSGDKKPPLCTTIVGDTSKFEMVAPRAHRAPYSALDCLVAEKHFTET